jgi:hypothetical protein
MNPITVEAVEKVKRILEGESELTDIPLEDQPIDQEVQALKKEPKTPVTKLEHMTAPSGYAFASKRPMKACRSCRWYQPYQEGNKVPKKKRRHACTKVVLDDHGSRRVIPSPSSL